MKLPLNNHAAGAVSRLVDTALTRKWTSPATSSAKSAKKLSAVLAKRVGNVRDEDAVEDDVLASAHCCVALGVELLRHPFDRWCGFSRQGALRWLGIVHLTRC
jgi:hypothetical protein